MSSLLVPNVDEKTLAHLQARALIHGWSLQAEVGRILEAEAVLADQKSFLGWNGEFVPGPDLEEEPDSVAQLLATMPAE